MEKKKSLFELFCELAKKDDAAPLDKHAGCWERKLDEQWWFAINGHKNAIRCARGPEVPPFNCYVEFNGWPAGSFDPFGGIMAAGGQANEEAFATALEAEIIRQ